MSAPVTKGWCPGALRPMPSGDGLLVRVRPHAGRLDPRQAAGLAALAERYGNGLIDLSNRANLQLRGVGRESHAPLIDGLRDLDLADENAEQEARRNIVVTPFWRAGDGAMELAAQLEHALIASDAPVLPGKFGFAIDSGAAPVLREVSADIRIERDSAGRLLCRADGAPHGKIVTEETAVDAALDLARWFLSTGGTRRMATHDAPLPTRFRQIAIAADASAQFLPGVVEQGVLAAPHFGRMTASMLQSLAELGAIRITPWRMVLLEGLDRTLPLPGLIMDSAEPLLRVTACPGAPSCSQALQPTRLLAERLAATVPPIMRLHVSGCAKGCAHPAPAPITLTATPDGFDLIHNATAASPPLARGLSAEVLLQSLPLPESP